MLNCAAQWRRVALMGMAAVGAQAVQAGGACGSPAKGNVQAEASTSCQAQFRAAMEWEMYHSVIVTNPSKSHWRLRPIGEKRSPMLDLNDPDRNTGGVLDFPPGQSMVLAFLFNGNEVLFQAQFLVEDNHEARVAVLSFQVDETAVDPEAAMGMTLIHAKDGTPFRDNKVLYFDNTRQAFVFLGDTYRQAPQANPGQKVPAVDEAGESLLKQGSPSLPAAGKEHGTPSFPSTGTKLP